MKHLFSALGRKFGCEIGRVSRSKSIAMLTGARNVLNAPDSPRRGPMESLGAACLALHMEWLMRDAAIDLVLDVGANRGQFACELREIGYQGRIVSFEPMAACVRDLERRARGDGAWEIFPFALGEVEGRHVLTHFADDTFSSLHAVAPGGEAEFGRLVKSTGTETVEVRRLEGVWSAAVDPHQPKHILLKTDTQGHDLAVLHGAGKHLARCTAVLCEASFMPVYRHVPSYHALFEYIEAHGFDCAGIIPLSYRRDRPAMIEANSLFVNRTGLAPGKTRESQD